MIWGGGEQSHGNVEDFRPVVLDWGEDWYTVVSG